jgi:hypothetical protein
MLGSVYSEKLFERALIEPAQAGGTDLYVVSGYASPAMVVRHYEELRKIGAKVNLDLQVGMTSKDGLPRSAFYGFQSVQSQIFSGKIQCRFNTGVPFHSKLYVWCDDAGPTQAFLGSANYSQIAFGIGSGGQRQKELLTEVEAGRAFDYIVDLSGKSVKPDDPQVESLLQISDTHDGQWSSLLEGEQLGISEPRIRAQSVLLPLVQTTKSPGEVHNAGAGLNWGQRGNRNRAEAYIPVPSRISNMNFFPDRGVRFQIFTDTGDSFVATIAQAGGKAIETPEDNALIGEYFRKKLGLLPGDFVTTESLARFGSNAVSLIKVNDELFHMIFESGLEYSDGSIAEG